MNILMLTNTFTPHVGGVARSVERFAAAYREQRYDVLIVAPEFEGMPKNESDVIRIPALQHFNGSDFSVPLPIPGILHNDLDRFQPHIVHSHHPFLLGDTALRISATRNIPIVFTHHTQYEKYTHYVPGHSQRLQRFVVDLAVGYCNLCDAVIAPSGTIKELLRCQGVDVRIEVIPTGVDTEHFSAGNGAAFRSRFNIPADAFVVGHVGRLAPEKGLDFLTRAVGQFLKQNEQAWFVVAGVGPSAEQMRNTLSRGNLVDRFVMMGILADDELRDAYHAMDVFGFASKSETQGMVLTEAMAAGVPVVAVDAPGVREVVRDQKNGRLLPRQQLGEFVDALEWIAARTPTRQQLVECARATADQFSMKACANRAVALYQTLIAQGKTHKPMSDSLWSVAIRRIEEEWKIWANVADAASDAFRES